MKTIEVIIQEDGKTAKEINPFACYGTQTPHIMDFDTKEEWGERFCKWRDAEKTLTVFEIESVTNVLGEVHPVKHYQLERIAGTKEKAEILENGKIKLLFN